MAFDVVVVGGRCAGAPLAALLARQGLKVAVVERAQFPKDTLSTHVFQAPGINFLKRLGVLDDVLATGAPPVSRINLRQEDLRIRFEFDPRPGDLGGFMSVRRFLLDPILLNAAAAAGAEVLMPARVVRLAWEGDRVTGVHVSDAGGGGERIVRARLVVGADGRNSTVADLTGARKYNVTPGERFGYWAFFADAQPSDELIYHRWDGRFVIALPTDNGLYQVVLLPDARFLPEFRQDRAAAFLAHARACRPVADVLAGAHQEGKMLGMLRYECFFRESAGPGWVLVGDAGQFKDPAPGQGISDAFRQTEALAPVIAGAVHGPPAALDAALRDWAAWRDRDAAEHHWLAADFGAAGQAPAVLVEVTRRLHAQGRAAELGDVFQHRRRPSQVVTPALLLQAAAGLMRAPGADRPAILREVRDLMATEAQRRRLARQPRYVAPGEHREAGETEVPEEVAA